MVARDLLRAVIGMAYPVRRRAGDRLVGPAAVLPPTSGFGFATEPSVATLRRRASIRPMTLRSEGFDGVSVLGKPRPEGAGFRVRTT
jgi:hypothetical protein